jgi:parvulin-like peptidyl-prolyl isomerase
MCSKSLLAALISTASLVIIGLVAPGMITPGIAATDRPDPQVHLVEEIVAKVNGEIITRGELAKQREEFQAELTQQGLGGDALQTAVNQRVADALRDQIDQLLLVQKGKELGINVDADVNRRIAEIQADSKISDTEKFHEWLQEQLHGISNCRPKISSSRNA